MAEQLTLIWETEFIPAGENQAARVVARRPLSTMSVTQAARTLGLSEWSVQQLWRDHYIDGYKPGARRPRKDGKGSNARLRLDAGSVLAYKAAREAQARKERGI